MDNKPSDEGAEGAEGTAPTKHPFGYGKRTAGMLGLLKALFELDQVPDSMKPFVAELQKVSGPQWDTYIASFNSKFNKPSENTAFLAPEGGLVARHRFTSKVGVLIERVPL